MFPQVWVAVVDAVRIDRGGWFADVTCMPEGQPLKARVALPGCGVEHGAPYVPLEPDDTVLVSCPAGDPGDGVYIVGRFFEEAEPVPAEIVDNPGDELWVAKSGRKLVLRTSAGDLVLAAGPDGASARGLVRLGSRTAGESVVLGDTYKGLEETFLDALSVYVDAVSAFANTVSMGALAPATATIKAAITAFKNAYPAALSDRVKAEK